MTTRFVNEGESIQAAINASAVGDTVVVGAGTFNESINIDRDISVISFDGAASTIINGQGANINNDAAVTISGSGATFGEPDRGFTVNQGAGELASVYITGDVEDVTVEANVLHGNETATHFRQVLLTGGGVEDIVITGNAFTGSATQFIYVNGNQSVANVSTNVDITNNTFNGDLTDVAMTVESTGGDISGNTFGADIDVDVMVLQEVGNTATNNDSSAIGDSFDLAVAESFDMNTNPTAEKITAGLAATDVTLTGNALNNTIRGSFNPGGDTLDGGIGADRMIGRSGDDTYIVDNIGDTAEETFNDGDDTVRSSVTFTLGANVENLVLTGTDDIDGTGNGEDNSLTGNSGDNRLNGKEGADYMEGGLGDDIYELDNVDDVVSETDSTDSGIDEVQSSISFSLFGLNVENLTLTGDDDIDGVGTSLNNIIQGNEGVNRLEGLRGNDTYIVENAGDIVVELENEGNDTVRATVDYRLANSSRVETLRTNQLADHASIDLAGNKYANTIIGNDGGNRLEGMQGDDTIIARDGADKIVGGKGGDDMFAGRDADADRFIYTDENDSGKSGSNVDRLFNFDRKTGNESNYDRIDLSDLDADGRSGDQGFRFVDEFSSARGKQSDGQVMIEKAGDDLKVLVDFDGNNTTDMVIRVMDIGTLHKADFIL